MEKKNDSEIKTHKRSKRYFRLLEEEVRTVDKALPTYMVALAIISVGFTFISSWTLYTLSSYSRTAIIMVLLIQPYLILYTFPLFYYMRKYRRLFFSSLALVYRRYGPQDRIPSDVLTDLAQSARKVQRYWWYALWFLLLYITVSAIVMILFFWRTGI